MKVRMIGLALLILLFLWPATSAFADSPAPGSDGGQIFVDEDVSLEPGQTFKGDLGVLRGDVNVPEGSVVDGDVFVAGGQATIAGQVNGNVAVMGGQLSLAETGQARGDVFAMAGNHDVAGQVKGNLSVLFGDVTLRSTASIEGDVLVAPGQLQREAGAQVRGNVVNELQVSSLLSGPEARVQLPPVTLPVQPQLPEQETPSLSQSLTPQGSSGPHLGRTIGRILAVAFLSLVSIAISMLIVLIWPRATRRVADCIAALPVQSLGLGLLTFLIAAGLEAAAVVVMILIVLVAAFLMATVVLIPVGVFLILLSWLVLLPVPLALAGGMILGWVALAELIGRRVLEALRVRDSTPLGAALVGLLLTVPVAAVLWLLKPVCCGWPFIILLASIGLGSVFHTRFGRQGCRSAKRTTVPDVLPPEAMDKESGQPDVPGTNIP